MTTDRHSDAPGTGPRTAGRSTTRARGAERLYEVWMHDARTQLVALPAGPNRGRTQAVDGQAVNTENGWRTVARTTAAAPEQAIGWYLRSLTEGSR